MKKKLLSLLLATIMVMSMLAGCGGPADDKTTKAPAGESTVSGDDGTTTDGSETTAESDEPVTLKVLICLNNGLVIDEPENMELVKKLDELAGVTTEWECVFAADWDTQWNLIMSGNAEDRPDIIFSRLGAVDVESYGVDQGVLIPVEDLVEQHLTNYTDRIAENDYDPTVSLKASDGHTYTIGYMSAEDISTWSLFFINQNWLTKLELEQPKNIEQLSNVFREFKAKDPNGNGEADEIPLSFVMDTASTSASSINHLLPLFGVPFGGNNRWLFVDDNKQVQFVPLQEGFRECMEWLHQLKEEGLLDVEALSQDSAALTSKLEDERVGFCTLWNTKGTTYAETTGLELYTPGEDAVLYNYLELASPRVYLTSNNDNLEKTMKWLNGYLEKETMYSFMRGRQNEAKDETYAGWYYNEEGKFVNMAVPKGLVKDFLQNTGLYFAPGKWVSDNVQVSANSRYRSDCCDVYEDANLLQKYSNDYLKCVQLTADEAAEKTLMEPDLNNAVAEYMAKFIQNGVTDATWAEFENVVKGIGYEKLVNMYQRALDTYEWE